MALVHCSNSINRLKNTQRRPIGRLCLYNVELRFTRFARSLELSINILHHRANLLLGSHTSRNRQSSNKALFLKLTGYNTVDNSGINPSIIVGVSGGKTLSVFTYTAKNVPT